jgi:hypothetical protein
MDRIEERLDALEGKARRYRNADVMLALVLAGVVLETSSLSALAARTQCCAKERFATSLYAMPDLGIDTHEHMAPVAQLLA